MRFEMPVAFGPTEIPDVSHWGRVEMASTSFSTTADAVRPLVPGVLDLPERPVVTVSRMTYADVDYLAGRGYNEVTVGITCTHPTAGRGAFSPVVWVDEVRPILIGREFMGYAKLGAELPPGTADGSSRSWTSTEYGAPLMTGRLTGLVPLEGDDLEAVRRAGAAVSIFNWKHIAGPQDTVDADYLTRTPMVFTWDSAGRGAGTVEFYRPEWREAPAGARALAVLSQLPVVAWRAAIVATGSGTIDRSQVTRCD